MTETTSLRPAETAELEQGLAHALQFHRLKAFKVAGEMMARVTAAHLVEQLRLRGYVVMKTLPAQGPTVGAGREQGAGVLLQHAHEPSSCIFL